MSGLLTYARAEERDRLAYLMGRAEALAEAADRINQYTEDWTTAGQEVTEKLAESLAELRALLMDPRPLTPAE